MFFFKYLTRLKDDVRTLQKCMYISFIFEELSYFVNNVTNGFYVILITLINSRFNPDHCNPGIASVNRFFPE